MGLYNFLLRRLVSLLRPWLPEDSDLRLNLGFTRSSIVAHKLHLNVSALNELFEETATSMSFKEVIVDHLSIVVTYWPFPAFKITVHDVHVTLCIREEISRGKRESNMAFSETLKKNLSASDPEGVTLHDIMKSFLDPPPRYRLKTASRNLLLKRGCLKVNNINLVLEFPVFNNVFEYSLSIKRLSAKFDNRNQGCLHELIHGIFKPLAHSCLTITGNDLEIVLKREAQSSRILNLKVIFSRCKLYDLQLVDVNLRIPELSLSVTPVEVSIYSILNGMSSKEYKFSRNGRQLWKLAARRISHITSSPGMSLHHLVTVVMLWIQYVNVYELLLLLTGYPTDNLMKKFTYKISSDRKLFISFKKHWMTILDIEKKLPIGSIAQGRKIARYRAIKNVECAEDKKEVSNIVHLKFFYQIFSVLLCIWKILCRIFCFIEEYVVKTLTQPQKLDGCLEIVRQDSNSQFCFMLNIGKLLVSIYPANEIQPPTFENLKSKFGIPSSFFLSFHFSFDALLVIYTVDLCEQSLLISCDQFNVTSLPSMEVPSGRVRSGDLLGSLKECDMEGANNPKSIVWGEPAQSFLPSDGRETDTADFGEVDCNPFLVKYLEGMWLRWKSVCMNLEESGIKYSDNPWFLCEINSSLTKSVHENSNTSLWKCNLALGKLNFALGYSSILSASLLLQLMQHRAYSWTEDERSSEVSSHPSTDTVDNREVCLNDKYEDCTSQMMTSLLKKLPLKHIQVAMHIAGSHIQMALEKDFHDGYVISSEIAHKGESLIAFDVHDVEIAVCPASSSDLAFLMENSSEADDKELEHLSLKEPRISKIGSEKYTSQELVSLWFYLQVKGLKAYILNLDRIQHDQIFIFNPMLVLSSIVRKSVHSFSENVNAFSVAFDCTTTGFTSLSYMEDLYLLVEVIGHLSSTISYLGSTSWCPQEFMKQNIMLTKPMPKFVYVKEASISCRTSSMFHGSFKIKRMDVILHNSRMSDTFNSSNIFSQKMAEINSPDCGIWMSVDQGGVKVTCEEDGVDILTDISNINSVIFRYHKSDIDESVFKSLQTQLLNCCLYFYHQISFSHFILTLSLIPRNGSSSEGLRNIHHSSISRNNELNVENSDMAVNAEGPGGRSVFVQDLDFVSTSPFSNFQLLVHIAISRILITRCSVYDILVGAHQLSKISSSLSVGGDFRTISWRIQGGLLFLETLALAFFINCFHKYCHAIRSLLSVLQFSDQQDKKAQDMVEITRLDESATDDVVGKTTDSLLRVKGKLLEVFILNVSNISLVLVVKDESDVIWEFVIKVDADLKFQLADNRKELEVSLSHFSILSHQIEETLRNNFQVPHFSSNLSSHPVAGELAASSQHGKGVQSDNDASSSKHPVSHKKISGNSHVTGPFCFSCQHYLLENLVASLSIEKTCSDHIGLLSNAWAGKGSLSGLDLTLSHSEIQVILLIVSSFSGSYDKEKTNEHKRQWLGSQQVDTNTKETFTTDVVTLVPDGTIVAIQDIHQHMYFSVEGGNGYNLVGVMHYSLVGDRALFRVEYKKQRMSSPVVWFSLISLYAKNAAGKHLRLNCCPRSGVVNISGTDDRDTALWRIFSWTPGGQKGDTDWEPYNQFAKRSFYLVNKNNDCGIAFVDGVPEFVRKPGNPFKFKIIHDFPTVHGVADINHYFAGNAETSREQNSHPDERIGIDGTFPRIHISIYISLTIVHDISDTSDILPLVCGCLSNMNLTLQISSNKTRVLCTSTAELHYFDAQRNSWQGILKPVDIFLYYRFSAKTSSTGTILHGVPVHIYCRTKELDISLNETSLDVILFVIGKLDLAGPYVVRSSIIRPNCCKVENRFGVNLQCQFHNKKSLTIGKFKPAFISLRHAGSLDQSRESGSVISFQLGETENFTTTIHICDLQPQTFSWRTRIKSVKDSKTYPGPLIVVDISHHPEDGLSIVISPMTRIHNESGLTMELRFRRNQPNEDECASVLLKHGDVIDDSMAMFDALNSSGGSRKALKSLSVGNFLLSFRPMLTDESMNFKNSRSVEWSDDFKGEKAKHLSGIFDKLSYKFRRALMVGLEKYSFSTASCKLFVDDGREEYLHFLIQCVSKDVHIMRPDESGHRFDTSHSSDVLQVQKQIFLLPTVRVSNSLYSDIHVLLSEKDSSTSNEDPYIGSRAIISSESTANFYVNPAIIFFTVTLTALNSTCKSVNSGDFVEKLLKQKSKVQSVDIDLDFGGGQYFASLRLARGHRGILEVTVFTPYALKNDTNFKLHFLASNKKTLYRDVKENGLCPPNLGISLLPHSSCSWFLKSKKVFVQSENYKSESILDLDALSGFTELSLQTQGDGVVSCIKLGVSLGSLLRNMVLSSQLVTIVPRYVVINESKENITVRQCYLQNDEGSTIQVDSKQKATLKLQDGIQKPRGSSLIENFVKKHSKTMDDSLKFIQFYLTDSDLSWSGPICIASLGRFYVKFKKQPDQEALKGTEFAAVHVVEEGSTLNLHFHKPPNTNLPYRIENRLHDFSITYYQKDVVEPEVLGSLCSVDYVWDDLTLPHELVVQINESLREINLDKLRTWRPLYKSRRQGGLTHHTISGSFSGPEIMKVGYEIYADGPTRILRICEKSDCHRGGSVIPSSEKFQLRISNITVHLLECWRQDGYESEPSACMPLVAARLWDISLDSVFAEQQKYNQITVQSLKLEEKRVGATFAAMLRRHRLDYSDPNDCVLKIVCVLNSTSFHVKQVKYFSVVLQPIDLNLDEETLMRIAPFWRTSLNDSKTGSQQYYFDHFEIHPIKIFANFRPEESYSSYSSTQETLRTLLHSVVKIPAMKNVVVELNGVLVTHALITMHELFLRCAQHYSWYAMRAIYIAKGSSLLPPDFISIFDDLSSSSLDVFFDPSRGFMGFPGTFKFIKQCIDAKRGSGTKRYFGDLGKTLRTAGSNVMFAAITEISDSVLKGAEASGFNGMVSGFHQGILKIAMEPSLLGSVLMQGGPDRNIKLDQSPGVDELYIEGYLQAMLDTIYRQEYLRVRVIDNQVILKNLPPNTPLMNEIVERVKGFLVSKELLKGDSGMSSRPFHHLRRESEWKIGPTVQTLCEHLFVSFAIRMLRKGVTQIVVRIPRNKESNSDNQETNLALVPTGKEPKGKFIWTTGIGKFMLSGIVAYIDGRLCRNIPNPIVRRIVSGFLLTLLDNNDKE
ncbi:uncharacterized protein LOC120072502 isoform X2 [Benincasa hispida]|uniref:uncharacterized protein LOC120072502 isoform X2 n=1 Tax=Benincasa hispida TaxID=102211 RepID=UPI0018FF8692|nr:uncharacterized protein LOC120072502 isoform X2 [Benincasa hispida]